MSDSNRVRLAAVRETVQGETPQNPKLKRWRITNAPSLAVTPETIESNELDDSYQVTDVTKVGQSASGDVGMEFSYDAQHEAMENYMRNDWAMLGNAVGPTDIVSIADDTITLKSGLGAGFYKGALINVGNANLAANNGTKKVTAVAGDVLTVPGIQAETPVQDDMRVSVCGFIGEAGGLTISGDKLTRATSSGAPALNAVGLKVGMFIKIGGAQASDRFNTAAVNGYARVKTIIDADNIQLTDLPTGWGDDNGAGKTVKIGIPNADITNGVLPVTHTVVESFLDHNPVTHQVFRGMRINNITMEIRPRTIVTTNLSLMGSQGEILDDVASGITGATYLKPSADNVINATSNVAELREGGQKLTGGNCVTNMTLAINNNFREDLCVGEETAGSIGAGTFQLTGTLATFFGDKTLVEKVINNTETSLLSVFKDYTGQVVLFDMPRVKYSSGSPGVPGKNTSTTAELGYQALRHPEYEYTLRVSKFRSLD